MVNEIYTFKKHVACRPTFRCHQEMAIYAEEPQGGGNIFWIMVSMFNCFISVNKKEIVEHELLMKTPTFKAIL